MQYKPKTYEQWKRENAQKFQDFQDTQKYNSLTKELGKDEFANKNHRIDNSPMDDERKYKIRINRQLAS